MISGGNKSLLIRLNSFNIRSKIWRGALPKDENHGPTLFLLYINDLPDDVICNIAIYADDTTLYSKCDQASDMWQQLELASELESDLRDMRTGAGSGLLISMLKNSTSFA